ncbi:MAG: RNA methyltransferase [Solidesulfovibrio sp.]|uniref:RNA methyltransferase n=1 Tax=Solidesulfovibrio sp. TaxID=2910990 RepID=UPI002B1FDAC3|nr:RNA methyltransferase [Solidesulfovibrio sp.]MEA4854999.1 RNA methyltransferase [Solidesulfovibrio sp.]
MLDALTIVLFRPKFSENVGAAARACANMGVSRLVLVDPPAFDIDRARPMATSKGGLLLDRLAVVPTLARAVAEARLVLGTTARLGGWRSAILSPEQAAAAARDSLAGGDGVAVVFGPEDAGLTNRETQLCAHLVNIPTAGEATSLNLAQAVLIVCYEIFKATQGLAAAPAGPTPSRAVSHAEGEALFSALRRMLLTIDCIKPDNPDYWMLPVRRFIERVGLKRKEYNLLMGICRQIDWAVATGGKKPAAGDPMDSRP